MEKKGDFNFVWLFAIIAGTAILLLAIMGAVRYGKTTSQTQDTEIAKTLAVVTDSMQAGFASGRKSTIIFKKDTMIENYCYEDGFGYSELSVMTQERANEQFESFGVPIKVTNKYLFVSDQPGKEFYVFSVPISFAFRIADAIIIDSQKYCFIGLDEEDEEHKSIRSTLSVLGPKNVFFGQENCTEESIKVCFDSFGDCEIIVHPECNSPFLCQSEFDVGRVEKEGYSLDYAGNLLYPAIFSERESYLCNLRRILYRQYMLVESYSQKIFLMSGRGCNVDLTNELQLFKQESFDLSSNLIGSGLKDLYLSALSIKDKEARGICKLWS